MKYKITGGTILQMGANAALCPVQADLYVADGKIAHVGTLSDDTDYETVDAKGLLVIPGLANMHTHAYMSFMRGCADDVSFDEWLFRRVMPIEDAMTGEDAYWSALLGCMEMISTGTTRITDMHMFKGDVPRAMRDAGIRANIGRGLVGDDLTTDGASRFREAMEEMAEYKSDLLDFILAPHAIYTCSERLLRQVNDKAHELSLGKEIHLAESRKEYEDCIKAHGKSPVEYLTELGFLDERTLLAHCVQLDGEDYRLLSESGAHVVLNPVSNAKLGNGAPNYLRMDQHGLRICIGTDGAASNNSQNLFHEMNYFSLLQKTQCRDPKIATAQETLRMATMNAGKVFGKKTGLIEEGYLADLTFLDMNALALTPANDIASALVYSANGSEVDSVMVGGNFVYRKKEFTAIDRERVLYETARIAKKYL